MSEGICRCGHERIMHNASGRPRSCTAWVSTAEAAPGEFPDGHPCDCARWDTSVLPEPGERLEFGRHRMNEPDAEAEAWPVGAAKIERTIRRAAGLPTGPRTDRCLTR